MKNLKLAIIAMLSLSLLGSCELFQEDTTLSKNSEGYNLAGFENTKQTVVAVADGNEYTFEVKMKVIGPTSMDLTKDITVTVEADAASTATEGTHFRIDNKSLTLKASDNYLGLLKVTVITNGIVAPLSKKLILNAVSASGDAVVTNNGKPLEMTINYACFSNLAGTYDVTTEYTGYDGSVTILNWTETITQTGVGEYRTGNVGHWAPADLGNTPGFTFYDQCGELTIPGQNLVEAYSNWVEGTESGIADGNTLVMEYSICVATGCRYYKSTYVKQ